MGDPLEDTLKKDSLRITKAEFNMINLGARRDVEQFKYLREWFEETVAFPPTYKHPGKEDPDLRVGFADRHIILKGKKPGSWQIHEYQSTAIHSPAGRPSDHDAVKSVFTFVPVKISRKSSESSHCSRRRRRSVGSDPSPRSNARSRRRSHSPRD